MRKMMNREDAFTGLEAAIVLIAFVVVAAVFSYVVLGAGFFTTQKSQEVVHTGVEAASSSLEILGDVYGLNTSADTPETCDFIRFTVGPAAGGTAIDLQKVTMVFMTEDAVNTLTKDSTVGDTITTVNTSALTPTTDGVWGVMEINNGGTDALVEAGEQFTILVSLPSGNELEVNEEFTIEIRPAVGASLAITKSGPAKIAAVNALY